MLPAARPLNSAELAREADLGTGDPEFKAVEKEIRINWLENKKTN